jgi:very-short-patch-repair endonuclease
MYCLGCDCPIPGNVYYYSTQNFGFPLCRNHQNWARNHESTEEALTLYFLLKQHGVVAELEKHDGHKSVDIVIEEAKVHIEVDGVHHNYDNRQALADLKRTYHSFKRGYFTLRIPNSLMRWNAEETANYITDFLEVGRKKNTSKISTFLGLFRR